MTSHRTEFEAKPLAATGETIERVEETAFLTKRRVTTGTVSVRTITEAFEETVTADLAATNATIKRIPVGRIVDDIPQTRVENGVTIVPVFEEVLVIERRIRLVEELHIRHEVNSESIRLPVTVRRQRAVVERTPVTSDERRRLRPIAMKCLPKLSPSKRNTSYRV